MFLFLSFDRHFDGLSDLSSVRSPARPAIPDRGSPENEPREVLWWLELRDLVERQFDRGLALEERDEDRELAALGLDLADRAGKTRERALLDRDGLADLEVDLGREHPRDGSAAALGGARLGGHDLL